MIASILRICKVGICFIDKIYVSRKYVLVNIRVSQCLEFLKFWNLHPILFTFILLFYFECFLLIFRKVSIILKTLISLCGVGLYGEGGIRTLGSCKTTPVFKTGALNHSATSP